VAITFIPGKILSEKNLSKLRSIAELRAFEGARESNPTGCTIPALNKRFTNSGSVYLSIMFLRLGVRRRKVLYSTEVLTHIIHKLTLNITEVWLKMWPETVFVNF
jgi:hypothetical protein